MPWALDRNDRLWGFAKNSLEELTGIHFPGEPPPGFWRNWWRTAGPLLTPDYDLNSAAGLAAWMSAWQHGDRSVRGLLLNLWSYAHPDETALFDASATNPAAVAVLAELWQHDRLSPATQKAIVARTLHPFLEEEDNPYPKQMPDFRLVYIKSPALFPFPRDAEMRVRAKVIIGENPSAPTEQDLPPYLADSYLSYIAENRLGGEGSTYEGPTLAARAFLEINGLDHSNPPQVLWTLTWQLGPLPLRARGL
jgi:hypothetical protein